MICSTVQNKDIHEITAALGRCEMAEIRLDSCRLSPDQISQCFISDVPLVATCRISSLMAGDPSLTEAAASRISEDLLIKAAVAGARYVDIELEAPKQMVKRVAAAARENGTAVIRSYHDFSGTDSFEALKAIVEKCMYHSGEIVKIVTTASSESDVQRVMDLYSCFDPSRLIAFCMGEAGRGSRLECLAKGAPFTYASLDGEPAAAPGQWPDRKMYCEVYGTRKFIGYPDAGVCASDQPCPEINVPSSKSFAQRAILAASLCDGVSRLGRYSSCGDNSSAVALVRSLGAEVSLDGDVLVVKGAGTDAVRARLSGGESLNVGESGLLTRLMIPLAGALASGPVTLSGEKTLQKRVISGADEIMAKFGVKVTGQGGECIVPLRVDGALTPGKAEFSGASGSQIISGLLMALPLLQRNSSFVVHDPVSIPYMLITVDILKKFGIRISDEMLGGDDFMLSEGSWDFCTDMLFRVKGGQKYCSADFDMEGDWSTAANFLVAGAVFGRAALSGLDTGSVQADLSIMDILMDAGASLSQYDGNDGCISVQRSPLHSFSVDASQCPDLFPIISVLAAFCQGTSEIGGVDRLAHKECDRGRAILDMLHQMGVESEVRDNVLRISGHSLAQRLLTGKLLKGGDYSTFHDHRMAMALSVASLGADSPVVLDDRECVAKSCPSFFDMLSQAGA